MSIDREPAIYFIADLCRVLRTSRRSIQRLRRFGAFPIPELPAIDKRPRWSRVAVERYLAEEHAPRGRRRYLRIAR